MIDDDFVADRKGDPDKFPEVHLWEAVLMTAIKDAITVRARKNSSGRTYVNNIQRSALKWIMTDNRMPNGFLSVCEIVGVDPHRVRAKIKERIGR